MVVGWLTTVVQTVLGATVVSGWLGVPVRQLHVVLCLGISLGACVVRRVFTVRKSKY